MKLRTKLQGSDEKSYITIGKKEEVSKLKSVRKRDRDNALVLKTEANT